MAQTGAPIKRPGVTAVHSLDRFVFTVPDLDEAVRFYDDFGLDVRRSADHIDLYTSGHGHRWGSVHAAPGRKRLQYLAFYAYEDDFQPLIARLSDLGVSLLEPHPLADTRGGVWFRDPEGVTIHLSVGPKVSPDRRQVAAAPEREPGSGAAQPRA